MNRLIDEKELINERPENLNPNMSDEIKSAYNKGWNACNSEWISLIDEQPTAYDIDKVVEQLKKLIDDDKVGFLRATPESNGYIQAINDAIEIVKRGGTE